MSRTAADATHGSISSMASLFSGMKYSTTESDALLRQLSTSDLTADDAKELVEQLAVLAGTDVKLNASQPYGDGDQSLVVEGGESSRQILRELFRLGGDLGPHLIHEGFSPFALACGLGNTGAVEKFIKATDEGSEERMHLLEKRESGLRLTPLLLTIALSKSKPYVCSVTGKRQADMDHLGVIKILLRYGARPDCKELLGKSAVHYGAGSHATSESLEMTDHIVDAAKSSSYFGKRVVLRNLKNESFNGLEGTLGGYLANTRRRQVILDNNQEGNTAIKPENIFSYGAEGGKEVCIYDSSRNLVNDCDRCGAISLHEVFMSERIDVAKFLTKHNVSVDITPPCGNSVRKMMQQATLFGPSKMHRVIQSHIARTASDAH